MRSRAFLGEIGVAIGAALAAATVGCSSQPVACGGCNCGDQGSPVPYDVTFDLCQANDAGGGDAMTDASDDAGDGGMCFATCDDACLQLKPSTVSGSSVVCMSTTPDAGTGPLTAHCETVIGLCTGRKLDGLLAPAIACDDPVGAWFAEAAWLEAASVGAFRRLARELRAHGAPAELVGEANAAARDEIRHARTMAAFAKKRGASVPRVSVREIGVRDLESIARENAVEGCVGETFGAAIAMWAADHAEHEDVRAASRAIAHDELRHAALGWAIFAWANERLDADARERVRIARDEAAREIAARTSDTSERVIADELGRLLYAA